MRNTTISSIKKKGMTISKGELSNHVCSLEWAIKLREVGVPQKSVFYWITWVDGDTTLHNYSGENQELVKNFYSAFLSSELGEILPDMIEVGGVSSWYLRIEKTEKGWCVYYNPVDWTKVKSMKSWKNIQKDFNLANAMAKMLHYLIVNKLLNLKEV